MLGNCKRAEVLRRERGVTSNDNDNLRIDIKSVNEELQPEKSVEDEGELHAEVLFKVEVVPFKAN